MNLLILFGIIIFIYWVLGIFYVATKKDWR